MNNLPPEVITAKKRLEMQKTKLWDNVRTLDEQAHRAVDSNSSFAVRYAIESAAARYPIIAIKLAMVEATNS